MNATQKCPQRKAHRRSRQTPARPVTEMLLEMAYLLHANKVVKRLTRNPAPVDAKTLISLA